MWPYGMGLQGRGVERNYVFERCEIATESLRSLFHTALQAIRKSDPRDAVIILVILLGGFQLRFHNVQNHCSAPQHMAYPLGPYSKSK